MELRAFQNAPDSTFGTLLLKRVNVSKHLKIFRKKNEFFYDNITLMF
jgi:hypothetical protein